MNNQEIIDLNFKASLLKILDLNDFKKALIFTSPGNDKRGNTDLFKIELKKQKIKIETFLVDSYPTLQSINHALRITENFEPDLVVSIGGGSTIDTAKVASTCTVSKTNYTDINNLKLSEKIFHISIPTTAGSGAESTKFATIWSKETLEKFSFEDEKIMPEIVFLLPELTKSLPLDITISTSLDALCHNIDSLLNKYKNTKSTQYAIESIQLINNNLPMLLNDLNNEDLRMNILKASNLAGKAINISRTSLNHAISYPLTNLYNLEHGYACAYSVIATIDMFKSDIEKLPFSKHLIDARNLISNIDLKSMVKNKISYQNSSEVMNLVIKNSRLANFLFNIQELQIHQILTNSKQYYLSN
jgi:alcohol dehydrogenase class IV